MMTGAAFFALGVVAGTVYWALLRWNTVLYLGGGRIQTAAAVQVLRLVALAGLLSVAALHGTPPLLLTAVGALIARPFVLHRMAGAA
jgi:N-ATPase, AtpR subunit